MKVIKNFLYNISYQMLVIILPLITVPYVSGILGAEGVGDYAFTYANMQYFVIFGMIGINLYGNRQIAYIRENKEDLKNTFFSIYTLQLVSIIISLVIYCVFVGIFNKDSGYKYLYIAQGLNIVAALFDISWLFMGLEDFKKTVIRNTIVKLVSLASIFIFVKSSDDIFIYATIIGLSALIGNITFWFYVPNEIELKNINICNIKQHLKSSMSLFIPQIAVQIYLLLDRTLLGVLTNNVEVGYYDNSQKIVKLVLTIATSLGTVMMPRIANTLSSGDIEKVKDYISKSFYFINGLAFPLMFGLMSIANELSPWFFTDKFIGIEKLIIISSVIILAISWSNVLGMQLLVPLNRTKEFTISVTTGAIINFILNLILIKKLGATGACISTIIAEFSVVIVQCYFVRDFINLINLFKKITIFIIPSIIMYSLVRIVGISMGDGIFTNIIQVVTGGFVYFISIFIIYYIFKKEDLLMYLEKIKYKINLQS